MGGAQGIIWDRSAKRDLVHTLKHFQYPHKKCNACIEIMAMTAPYNSVTDTPILSVKEAMCRGHFRLLEYQTFEILKQYASGPFSRKQSLHLHLDVLFHKNDLQKKKRSIDLEVTSI